MNITYRKLCTRLVLVSSLIVLVPGCSEKKSSKIGTIINSVGKHPVNGSYFDYIEIRKSDSGGLRKWVGFEQGPTISENRDLTNGWFVFVESESRVWTYFGEEQLQLAKYSESEPPQAWATFVFSEIPHSVVSQLPLSLKDKLEGEQDSRHLQDARVSAETLESLRGKTEPEVIAVMGKPSSSGTLIGGFTSWEFSRESQIIVVEFSKDDPPLVKRVNSGKTREEAYFLWTQTEERH